MKLYGHPISGNSHRVQLFLSILGIDYDYVRVNLMNGEHKTPSFLGLNPLGQVPVLEDEGVVLRDSTAILVYLARRFDVEKRWLPMAPVEHAQVQQWLSTAVNELQAGPFVMRLVKILGAPLDYAAAARKTQSVFDALLEPHLERCRWLVGETATIADLACYGYIARAPEGGFRLEPYPAVRAWLKNVEGLDGFVPMCAAAELS